ncbi:GNAT family N-acetyltransferase [Sphaerisporangium sp. TRM90804]|uniref:GNAT family N-acetyltransferase n=1 Tax=Sphaerisporangium sp. TRM90804 TaxID=3031113 RepID=UPI00244C7D52|nr:GNAT family N-acetyltransferase [Sphaerisporangium sp. TRM90804]MDH2429724.1 GNAT family N-acetyltransferase [Sphaerisporangium sp. TRM90804]
MTINTKRLVLRPFEPGDTDRVRAIVESRAAFLPPGAPGHLAGVSQWLTYGVHELWRSGQGIHLAMVADGMIVGAVSLFRTVWGSGTTEIGYGVHPAHRGRGYAPEAVAGLTEWALTHGGLRRVELRANLDNPASLRVAEKCGFTREGVLRGGGYEDDGPRDLVIFGLLSQDLSMGPPTVNGRGFGTGVRMQSEHLVMRPFTGTDAGDVFAAVDRDPEINRWMPWAEGYDLQRAYDWCTRYAHTDALNGVQFAIEPRAGGRLVGSVGVQRADWERGDAEVGYWISPWARRRGYACEATRAVSTYLMMRGFHRVTLLAAVGNLASQGVARKAGFVEEGVLRRALPVSGGISDAVLFSLLKDEVL